MSSATTMDVSIPRPRWDSTLARMRASPSGRSIHRNPVLREAAVAADALRPVGEVRERRPGELRLGQQVVVHADEAARPPGRARRRSIARRRRSPRSRARRGGTRGSSRARRAPMMIRPSALVATTSPSSSASPGAIRRRRQYRAAGARRVGPGRDFGPWSALARRRSRPWSVRAAAATGARRSGGRSRPRTPSAAGPRCRGRPRRAAPR